MLFIFGWNHQKTTNFGPVEEHLCQNCNSTKMWTLSEVSRYFTLFFVPIFPHDRERWLLCPICTYGIKLEKEDFESYKKMADIMEAYHGNRISESEKNENIERVRKEMDQRYFDDRAKQEGESVKWEAMASEKTDAEILHIITKQRGEYSLAFLIALEKEADKRNLRSS